VSKTEEVYQELRRRILSGELVAGYRLVIDALAREFGVSPIPVREAIRRLEAEDLVDFQPNVGAQVSRIDEKTYEEVLTVEARLEGWATALAAPYLTPDDYQILRMVAQHMDQALDHADLRTYGELNRQFHQTIRQRCPNRYLVEQIATCAAKLDRVRSNMFTLVPERARASLQEHYQILQSLLEKAPKEVLEHLVEDHQLQTLESYRAHRRQRRLTAVTRE
jgi:DNA-binding GntR family transcriptional regulator